MLTFTDRQIHAEAVRLGLIAPVEDLPQHLRSKVVASLASPQPPAAEDDEPAPAPAPPDADAEITVYADGPVLLNGGTFPLYVAREPIEVTTQPGGQTTVRLTLIAGTVHLLPGTPDAGTAG